MEHPFYMLGAAVSTLTDSGETGALKELAEAKQTQPNGMVREQFKAKCGQLKWSESAFWSLQGHMRFYFIF